MVQMGKAVGGVCMWSWRREETRQKQESKVGETRRRTRKESDAYCAFVAVREGRKDDGRLSFEA